MGCDTVCGYPFPEEVLTMLGLVGWSVIALIAGLVALTVVAWVLAWSHSRRETEGR